ncbi:MAG: dephospho-CoA kinase [Lactovum sp.]
MTKVIGLTGGIATGKSTVSKILSDLGYFLIDADKLVHKMQEKEGKLFTKIVQYFGEEILVSEGELNRKKIGQLIFSDNKSYQKLAKIQDKIIEEEIKNQLKEELKKNRKLIFLDIPLLFEGNYEKLCDEVWLVTASQEIQVSRLKKRSNLTRKEALQRIQRQMSQEEKMKRTDIILENTQTIEELRNQILIELKRIDK